MNKQLHIQIVGETKLSKHGDTETDSADFKHQSVPSDV